MFTASARVEVSGAGEAKETKDADGAAAVGATQQGRRRWRRAGSGREQEGFASMEGGEPADGVAGDWGVGAEEAVVADLLEAGGQDVLEEAAEELVGFEPEGAEPARSSLTIGEDDLVVIAGADAVVAGSCACQPPGTGERWTGVGG